MSTIHISQGVRPDWRALRARASSATLYVNKGRANQAGLDADPADLVIAQDLLQMEPLGMPSRRNSFIELGTGRTGLTPATAQQYLDDGQRFRAARHDLSNTWTSSSGDGVEDEGLDDRTAFLQQYNTLAKKYGVQPIILDQPAGPVVDKGTAAEKQGSWIVRKLLRRSSSIQLSKQRPEKTIMRHKRSVSDLSIRMKLRKDALKDKCIEEVIRLCGTSSLYLPAEYAAGTLLVPTCFRATAQYLVQHGAECRGVFRIPGSHNTINALYDHYASPDGDEGAISGTVRCPTLPEHIPCSVHDVASVFKKFLSGLPGGILGKVWLFEAFLSIYTQLDAEAELTRTKQSKIRARLIALAIGSLTPRPQRELVCAVFGLLSLIGRVAETAPREDGQGRPLPTSDLMGYGALGIIFGPLLIGDLLENRELFRAGPAGMLTFTERGPPKSSRSRQKKSKSSEESDTPMQVADRMKVVNCITEMLITHWRDVVRHMRNLGVLRSSKGTYGFAGAEGLGRLRPSISETFMLQRPPDWLLEKSESVDVARAESPSPPSYLNYSGRQCLLDSPAAVQQDGLAVRKRRSGIRLRSSQLLSNAKSISVLSPTREETGQERNSPGFPPQTDFTGDTNLKPRIFQTTGSPQNFAASADSGDCASPTKLKLRLKDPFYTPEATSSGGGSWLGHDNKEEATVVGQTGSRRGTITGRSSRSSIPTTPSIWAAHEIGTTPYEGKHKANVTLKEQEVPESRQIGSAQSNRKARRPSIRVPQGLVSARIHGIITKDPGREPPTPGSRALVESTNLSSVNRRHQSQQDLPTPKHVSVKADPLARVSQEEDIASLASLAEVLDSEVVDAGETVSMLLTNMPNGNCTPTYTSEDQNLSFDVLDHRGTRSGTIAKGQKSIHVRTSDSTSTTGPHIVAQMAPITPQKTRFDSGGRRQRIMGSVKALAAKFDRSQPTAGHSTSPTKTPTQSRGLISSYTVNASPASKSQVSNTPDRSLQQVRNTQPAWRQTSVSPTKSDATIHRQSKRINETPEKPVSSIFRSTSKRNSAAASPRPTRLTVVQNAENKTPPAATCAELHKNAGTITTNMILASTTSTLLQNTGDGTTDVVPCEQSNITPMVSGRELEKSSESITSEAPTPFQIYISQPEALPVPVSPFRKLDETPRRRSASMLYALVQELERKLKVKVEEVERLKLELASRTDLDDLTARLRITQTDMEYWRYRAETAEGKLQALSEAEYGSGPGNFDGCHELEESDPGEHQVRKVLADVAELRHEMSMSFKGAAFENYRENDARHTTTEMVEGVSQD